MRFDILTIFPQLLNSPLQEGIIRRAVADLAAGEADEAAARQAVAHGRWRQERLVSRSMI